MFNIIDKAMDYYLLLNHIVDEHLVSDLKTQITLALFYSQDWVKDLQSAIINKSAERICEIIMIGLRDVNPAVISSLIRHTLREANISLWKIREKNMTQWTPFHPGPCGNRMRRNLLTYASHTENMDVHTVLLYATDWHNHYINTIASNESSIEHPIQALRTLVDDAYRNLIDSTSDLLYNPCYNLDTIEKLWLDIAALMKRHYQSSCNLNLYIAVTELAETHSQFKIIHSGMCDEIKLFLKLLEDRVCLSHRE